MNAAPTPMNLNPGNAVQAPAQPGKQADTAAPDVPFSQVLSREIAQNRKSDQADAGTDDPAAAELAVRLAVSTDASADPTIPAIKATDAGKSTRDPLDSLPTDGTPASPNAALALAIQPDPLKPAPAGTDGALPEEPAAGTPAPAVLEVRTNLAPRVPQAGQRGQETAGAQQTDPALRGKAEFQAATAAAATPNAAATATAFSEHLAEARQPDAKRADLAPDSLNTPALQAMPRTPLDTPAVVDRAAASTLAPSVGSTAWGQALGEKIVWMATGAQQTASLTLNPPNLGPLQIVLNVSNDQATANFFSAQPEVRQALESAFPRLREMMNEAGIQLGQATVSADTPRQNDTPDRQAHRFAPAFVGTGDVAPAALQTGQVPRPHVSGRGLVDTFA
ncbi:MAG TPA: flagellar hook-length control protein FliK [Thiobacillus sp.]